MSCGRRSLRTVVQNPTEIAFFSRTRSIRSECIAEANRHCPQKAAVLPWCVVLLPVVYGYLWGWQVAFTHAAVNIVCSLTLARRTSIDGSCLMRGRHLASSGSIWGNGHSLPNFPLIGDNSPYHSQSALRD